MRSSFSEVGLGDCFDTIRSNFELMKDLWKDTDIRYVTFSEDNL